MEFIVFLGPYYFLKFFLWQLIDEAIIQKFERL